MDQRTPEDQLQLANAATINLANQAHAQYLLGQAKYWERLGAAVWFVGAGLCSLFVALARRLW